MKKLLALLMAVLMICLSLAACGGDDTSNPAETTPGTPEPSATTTPAPDDPNSGDPTVTDPPPVTEQYVVERFYTDKLVNDLKQALETTPELFKETGYENAPYVIQNDEFITDGKVLSISFPLMQTKRIDSDGAFRMTVYIYEKSIEGLRSKAVKEIAVKADAATYNLTEYTDYMSWITLDVSEYDIVLTDTQTLGFFSVKDTLIPLYTSSSEIEQLIDAEVDSATGHLKKIGTNAFSVSTSSLIYDFEIQRSYTVDSAEYEALQNEEASFNRLVEALAAKYEGKTISFMGDSITSYDNITNNGTVNSTIVHNPIGYYTNANSYISDSTFTYWGRLVENLNLELCVNNAWSGGRVYGKSGTSAPYAYGDSSVFRASQLHRNDGTEPDVILFYMGINDINNKVPFGTLLDELEGKSDAQKKQYVKEWVDKLLLMTNNGKNVSPGSSYTTFQEAYALTVHNMQYNYPEAEIYLMNLIPCVKYMTQNGNTFEVMEEWNEFYALMADYFEVNLIDQYGDTDIDFNTNTHLYHIDTDDRTTGSGMNGYIHPNAGGHKKMFEVIIRAMAKANGIS